MTTNIVRPRRTRHTRQQVIEDVEWIIGTDSPESIAVWLAFAHRRHEAMADVEWARDIYDRIMNGGAA